VTVIPDVLDPAWSADPPSTAVVVTETSAPYAEYVSDQVAQADEEAAFMARVVAARAEGHEQYDAELLAMSRCARERLDQGNELAGVDRWIRDKLDAAISARMEAIDPIEQARRDLNRGKTLLAIPDIRDQDREREQRKATIEQWRRDVLSGRVDPWERRK
jgi:hypothetical protein